MNRSRRIRIAVMALTVMSVIGLSGCGVDRAKQNELKEAGIKRLENNEPEAALTNFQEAIALAGTGVSAAEVDICYYKGAAQNMMGEYDDAIETYTGLITYNEKDGKAYFLRGITKVKNEDPNGAIEDFIKASELSGTDEMLFYGFTDLMTSGYKEEALKFYDQTKDSITDTASLLYEQLAAYEAAGDFDSARDAASKYLALQPDNSEVSREYDFLQLLK